MAAAAPPTSSSPNQLKIMSFNVASPHFMHFNKRIVPTVGPMGEVEGDTLERAGILANLIFDKSTDCDFICIQEGFRQLETELT